MPESPATQAYLDGVRRTEARKNLSDRLSFLDRETEKKQPIPLNIIDDGSKTPQADLFKRLLKNTRNNLEKTRTTLSRILGRQGQLAKNQAVSRNEINLTEAVQNDILHTDVNKKVRQ